MNARERLLRWATLEAKLALADAVLAAGPKAAVDDALEEVAEALLAYYKAIEAAELLADGADR